MKRIKNLTSLLLLVATILVLVTACSFFNPSGGTQNKFSVTLDLNGGTGVSAADFIDGGKLKSPDSAPVKSGYEFGGWFFDKECTEEATFGKALTKDVTVYAKWTARPYKATVVLGGNDNREVAVNDEGKFVIPAEYEVKTGYEFNGWFSDVALKTPADFTETVSEDKVFYGKWTAVKYEISYLTDGVAKEPLDAKRYYTVDDKVIFSSPSAIKSGYDFLGWFDEEGKKVVSIEKGSTGNIVLTAKFICRNNYIEYVKGGSVDGNAARANLPNSTAKIDVVNLITVSDRAAFVVKDGGGNVVEKGKETALAVGDNNFSVTVKAEDGTEREYTLNVYRYDSGTVVVTFTYPGLFTDETVSVPKGAVVQEPERKDATGYDFIGWFTDEEYTAEYDFNSAVVTEITIYAKYDARRYNIKYCAGVWETDAAAPSTFTIADVVPLPPPASKNAIEEEEKYIFDGWYTSGNSLVTEIAAGTCNDVEVFARYSLKDDKKIGYLGGKYSPDAEIYASEFIDYLNYCSYARRTSTSFILFVPESEDKDNYVQGKISEFVKNNDSAALLGVVEGSSFSKDTETKTLDGVVYNKYNVTINLDFVYPTEAKSDVDAYTQLKYDMHEFVSARSDDYDAFAINYISDSVSVEDTDKLLFAVINGYRPEPVVGSSAECIYNKAKSALRKIVDDGMSDVEKAHAIYDYLILNVAYDYDLLNYVQNNPGLNRRDTQKYNGFALEGVFDDGRAVCDGISKAYALMCNIEGIECLQVTGNTVDGVAHAWNKFKIDGKWYNADPTGGGLLLSVNGGDSAEGITHRYFMLTDEEMRKSNIPDTGKTGLADKVAGTKYNFFSTQTFTYGGTEYDYVLESAAEWKIAARYVKTMVSEYGVGLIAEFKTTAATENEAKAAVKTAFSGIYNGTYVVYFDVNTQVVIIWLM